MKKGDLVGFDLLSPRWEQFYYYRPFGGGSLFLLRLDFVLNIVCRQTETQTLWIPPGLMYELKLTFDKHADKLVYRDRDFLDR